MASVSLYLDFPETHKYADARTAPTFQCGALSTTNKRNEAHTLSLTMHHCGINHAAHHAAHRPTRIYKLFKPVFREFSSHHKGV